MPELSDEELDALVEEATVDAYGDDEQLGGFAVATDLNHHSGNSTVEQGAEIIVVLATLAQDGPTSTFQAASSTRPW